MPGASVEASKAGTKRNLVLTLLRRPDGASSAELIAATGWLAHTTRAALSRLRSAGQTLEKSVREDGATAYRTRCGTVTDPSICENAIPAP